MLSAMPDAPPRPIKPPERCEECGWQAANVTADNAVVVVSDLGPKYRAALTRLLPADPENRFGDDLALILGRLLSTPPMFET